jgi:hypothetical protein
MIVDIDRGVILRRHQTAKTPILEDKQLHTAERPPLGRAVPTLAPSSLTLSEPHARLGVIEEFDSEGLQCKLHFADGHCAAGDRLGALCFHVSDRVHVDPGRVRHLLLINPRQSARGLQLISSGEHGLVSIPNLGLT